MRATGSSVALVAGRAGVKSAVDVRGVIGESEIPRAMRESLDLFVD